MKQSFDKMPVCWDSDTQRINIINYGYTCFGKGIYLGYRMGCMDKESYIFNKENIFALLGDEVYVSQSWLCQTILQTVNAHLRFEQCTFDHTKIIYKDTNPLRIKNLSISQSNTVDISVFSHSLSIWLDFCSLDIVNVRHIVYHDNYIENIHSPIVFIIFEQGDIVCYDVNVDDYGKLLKCPREQQIYVNEKLNV